ncbi:MAG: methyl-galactoside ABC transporter substrate-binding protein, partial [Erysipelotrichales bacterium]
DEYMADFETRIKAEINQSFLVKTYDGQNSQIIQNDDINQMLEAKVPLMIINPVDRLSVYSIIEKAKLKGTKIIFINREPLQQDMALSDSIYYDGADAIESAQLQAQIVMALFGNYPLHLNEDDKNGDGIIQAVILKGELGHQDAEARTKYVIDTLTAAHYKVEVLEVSIANFDQNQGKLAMDHLLDVYGDRIEVVISNNDAMALGAITSLTDKGFFDDINQDGFIDRNTEKWMPVVGIDGLDIAIAKIEEGYLFGTVFNDSQNMAEAIIELAQFLLEGKNLNEMKYSISDGKYIWINYKKITLP